MSGQFKVGEVLLGQNHVNETEYNGMECTVMVGLAWRKWRRSFDGVWNEGFVYIVEWATGERCVAQPHNLRRKQPPTGEQSVLDMFKLPAPSKEIA